MPETGLNKSGVKKKQKRKTQSREWLQRNKCQKVQKNGRLKKKEKKRNDMQEDTLTENSETILDCTSNHHFMEGNQGPLTVRGTPCSVGLLTSSPPCFYDLSLPKGQHSSRSFTLPNIKT